MNDNVVSGRVKSQLIVGSPLFAQDKLDFVAKKVETISISQRKLAKEYLKKECDNNGGLLLPDKDISDFLVKMLKQVLINILMTKRFQK